MIRNLIFDMGNVILGFDSDELLCRFSDSKEERDAVKKAVFSNGEWAQLDKGTITEEDAEKQILARTAPEYRKTAERFLREWHLHLPILEETCDLIEELKEKGYGIYLLSNASLRFHEYKDQIPAFRFMDGMIVSADHLSVKPEPDIYQKLFSTYGLKPEECFFIDDIEENIEGGRALGMDGFIYDGNMEHLREELCRRGVPVSTEKKFEIIPVKTEEQRRELAALANEIWNQHFVPIIGQAQVDYMLQKFQCYEAMTDQMENQGYEYFFSCYNGRNVGYTAIQREEDALFLSKLYLRRAYRGRKLAKQVLEFLTVLCRENGLKKIWLTVNRHNANTIAVYQKSGFQVVREAVSDIGNGFVMDDYIMEKIIDL